MTKLDPRSGAAAEGDRGRQRAGRDRRRLRRRLGRQPRRRHGHADRRGDRRGHRHGARRRQPGRGRRRTGRDLGGRRRRGHGHPHRPEHAHGEPPDRARAARRPRSLSPAARCGRRRPRRARATAAGRCASRPRRSTCNCIDPAGYDGRATGRRSRSPMTASSPTVAFRAPAAARSSPTSPTSVPQPSDGGRTYTFQLRPGLRFSDGAPVRPEDFRASIERVVRLMRPDRTRRYYRGIVGAEACSPRRCDLSKGIETDAAARTIIIHLRRPDPEFMHKLAMPLAYVLPAGAPATLIRGRPPPGTGPTRSLRSRRDAACGWYAMRASALVARGAPDGFPDAIDVTISPGPGGAGRRRASTAARTRSSPPAASAANCRSTRPARSRSPPPAACTTAPAPTTNWLFLNVHERAVRRPARPPGAELRDRPPPHGRARGRRRPRGPDLPGDPARAARLRPTCPYTARPDAAPAAGRRRISPAPAGWSRRPGTRGARVRVLGAPEVRGRHRYAGEVLRRLGYRVRVRCSPTSRLLRAMSTTRATVPRSGSRAGSPIS